MDKQQIERIKSMLQSDNIDDINLAGNLIKTQVLKIDDEQVKLIDEFTELVRRNKGTNYTMPESLLTQLLNGNVKEKDNTSVFGIKDISRGGTLIISNE